MPRKRQLDLTDKRFGFFIVLGRSDYTYRRRGKFWECKCECGTIKHLPTQDLHSIGTHGFSIACGCQRGRNKKSLSNLRHTS